MHDWWCPVMSSLTVVTTDWGQRWVQTPHLIFRCWVYQFSLASRFWLLPNRLCFFGFRLFSNSTPDFSSCFGTEPPGTPGAITLGLRHLGLMIWTNNLSPWSLHLHLQLDSGLPVRLAAPPLYVPLWSQNRSDPTDHQWGLRQTTSPAILTAIKTVHTKTVHTMYS